MSGYVIHPPYRAVMELHRLPLAETAVACAYALSASPDGTGAYPSLSTVAERAGSSRQAVARIRDRLVEAGVLRPSASGRGYDLELERPVDMLTKPKRNSGLRECNSELHATQDCTHATQGCIDRNSELHEGTQKEPIKEPTTSAPPIAPPIQLFPDSVERIFDAWVASTGRTRSKLDAKRRALIEKALTAYPVDDLLLAVDGWKHSSWHRGENRAQRVYNDLELILRDAKHIEQFIGYAETGAEAESDGYDPFDLDRVVYT